MTDLATMNKMFWPLAIGFLTGAGVAGFLVFEALGGEVSTAHWVLATLTGGLLGALVGGMAEAGPLE